MFWMECSQTFNYPKRAIENENFGIYTKIIEYKVRSTNLNYP